MRLLGFVALCALLLPVLSNGAPPWPVPTWPESSPEEQGMNSSMLWAGDAYVRGQCPSRYSFLVVRNGYLVWESYFHGMSRDRYADVMSISKSVLSLMIGQALEKGVIPNLDVRMADYFPEYFSYSTDPRKREITLRQMLTMTAGLQWDETATGNTWVPSRDWYKFVIDQPMTASPGAAFAYNTGLSHLMAGMLSRASGQPALDVGKQNLFSRMGIENFHWERDPRGNYVGGFHMHFTSRDLAKFGYLMLRRGYWVDRQLVPRQWMEDSTSVKVSVASETTIGDYAYHWWVRPQAGYHVFMASGRGGQYIFVVPGLDLVMVSTANYETESVDIHMQAFNLLTRYVIPAIRAVTDPHVAGTPRIESFTNAANPSGNAAPGGWATITGSNLSATSRVWRGDDLAGANLPFQLDGATVTVDGKPTYVASVSPERIELVVPAGVSSGSVPVRVTSAPGYSKSVRFPLDEVSPAVFLWDGKFAVAQHADYSLVGKPGFFPYLATTPARPGETVLLYVTGLGGAALPSAIGEIPPVAITMPSFPSVTIGGVPAVVEFAGLPAGSAGLFQIAVRVPDTVPDGDLPITLVYGQVAAPAAYLTICR